MDVSIVETKNRLSQLIRAVENGEPVVITRKGRPVAQLLAAPTQRRSVRFGGMRSAFVLTLAFVLTPGGTIQSISIASLWASFEGISLGYERGPSHPHGSGEIKCCGQGQT